MTDQKALYGVLIFIMVLAGLLMFNVVVQQNTIKILESNLQELERTSETHDEVIEFIQKGKRFTYTDGRVLYLMFESVKDQEVCDRIEQIYSEHGETDFSRWLNDIK